MTDPEYRFYGWPSKPVTDERNSARHAPSHPLPRREPAGPRPGQLARRLRDLFRRSRDR
jgi:hypothetical protein